MAVLLPIDLLSACVTGHSDAFIEVLLIFMKLISIFFEHHLQELDCATFESEDKHHIADFLFLQIFRMWFEDVDEFDNF